MKNKKRCIHEEHVDDYIRKLAKVIFHNSENDKCPIEYTGEAPCLDCYSGTPRDCIECLIEYAKNNSIKE